MESIGWQTLLALISALTALVSAVVGPLAAYKIARRQIRASTAAADHKEWIHSFVDDVSRMNVIAHRTLARRQDAQYVTNEFNSDLAEADILCNKLFLRLDMSQQSHVTFEKALSDYRNTFSEPIGAVIPKGRSFQLSNTLRIAARNLIATEIKLLKDQ